MKKLLILILGLFLFSNLSYANFAEEIDVFVREDCAHCKDEKQFLSENEKIKVNYYDLSDEENYDLWIKFTEKYKLSKVTPITLVGDVIFEGFSSPETTGKQILDLVDKGYDYIGFRNALENNIELKSNFQFGGTCDEDVGCSIENESDLSFDLPFIGVVDVKSYSLPFLALILGFIDGFNPCAMWVLVTFLVILAQAGSRKRMWQMAGLFILAETVMYYLILNVWLTTWNFVALDNIITPVVGAIAIGAGCYFLYDWYCNDGTCKITNFTYRSKVSKKIGEFIEREFNLITILGILGLAFSVNIIEFACSIGIPQVFTKLLDINELNFISRQFLILIYILFYMIDDFIVFGIALYSFERLGITSKYSKLSHLIGGILMLILGYILLFNPELLVFG